MTFSEESQNAAIDAYNITFYQKDSDLVGYYSVSTTNRGKPGQKEIEALEDAYQRTDLNSPKKAIYHGMITEGVQQNRERHPELAFFENIQR